MADAPPPAPADESLSPLQLADGLLENVTKCPDCSKPVLQSAMNDHQANCLAIREGRIPDGSSLKRRLSEVSNGSGVPQKKSKLVLHLGGPAAGGAAPAGGAAVPAAGDVKPVKQPDAPKKNKRVVDVDRQCGVINDKGYPCPRSLTCKTHNMSAKRAVPHRSQPYDLLLFEWQKTTKANQQKAEQLKQSNPASGAGAGSGPGLGAAAAASGGASGGAAGAGAGARGGTARTAAAAAAGAAGGHDVGAPPLVADHTNADAPKAKRRRSSNLDAQSTGAGGALAGSGSSVALSGFKLPGEGGGGGGASGPGKKGKKGIVYVGEWDESDDDGADELVDSDEEVEAVLRGLARAEHGRPLFIARGGGAGFAAASLFTGRNTKLGRLRGTLRDVFRPAA
ncbi:hypothetical protein JCM8208_002049 [Rhodotorula glutinis]